MRGSIDAPVSGGPEGAKAKTLAIMVGGDKKIFDENIELLKTSGKSVVYCGESGLGLAAKIANNLIVGAQMAAIAEGVSLAVKAGIDINQLYEVLKNSSSNSATLNAKLPKIISKDFDPSFKLSLMYKDMTVAANVGRKLGTPTLMTTLAEQIYGMCMKDHSGEDFAAIVKFFADQSQVEL